ncbi:MAG: SH3 domain-containing protein [Chloroflexota bacterium]|nr:SH3 domain-containing protein [Chloroflexota bacterium]MDE2910372.1 SH3 domain-containing protein [Chloroflexota bacterium]
MINMTIQSTKRVAIALSLCIVLAATMTVQARNIHVLGECDLRDAIRAANYNSEIDGCAAGLDPDIVVLHHDVDIVHKKSSINIDGMEVSASFNEIESNVTLEGNGRIVKLGDRRAFVVDGGHLTLRNVRLRYASNRSGDIALINEGGLTLINASIENCSGGMEVEKGTIQLQGNSAICHHSHEIVYNWFDYTPPPPPTCAMLEHVTVRAAQGMESGIECRDIDAAGVGNQTVYDTGYIDAVDLFGNVGPGAEICFPQYGAIMFLDAAFSPRALSTLESYRSNGMTCANLNRAGTVVLVNGQPTRQEPAPVSEPAPAPASAPEPAPAVSEPSVDGCPIRTTGHINFRAEPSLDAERLGVVFRGTTVGAIRRVWGWYQINFQGRTGWIGGRYVDNIGNCQ